MLRVSVLTPGPRCAGWGLLLARGYASAARRRGPSPEPELLLQELRRLAHVQPPTEGTGATARRAGTAADVAAVVERAAAAAGALTALETAEAARLLVRVDSVHSSTGSTRRVWCKAILQRAEVLLREDGGCRTPTAVGQLSHILGPVAQRAASWPVSADSRQRESVSHLARASCE